jgi:hypothetical protein
VISFVFLQKFLQLGVSNQGFDSGTALFIVIVARTWFVTAVGIVAQITFARRFVNSLGLKSRLLAQRANAMVPYGSTTVLPQ